MNQKNNPPLELSLSSAMDVGAPLTPVGRRISFKPACIDSHGSRRAPSPSSISGSPPSSQEQLVRACLLGADADAFRKLYDRYRAAVQRICMRVTGSVQDAEDAAQDTFLVVHEKLGTFRFQSRFSSWIFRIAYNKSVELLRSRRRVNPLRRGYDASDPIDGLDAIMDQRQPSVSDELCERESCERIARAVGRLSPRLRRAASMRYLDQLSYKEIGKELSIPIGTVRSRLSRARESVRVANAS